MKKTKKEKKKGKVPEFDISLKYYHNSPKTDLEKFIFDRLPEIVKVLGIGAVSFYVQTLKDIPEREFETDSGSMLLSINYQKDYKTAYINISPQAIRIFSDGQQNIITGALVHEVSHILTSELGRLALDRIVTKKLVDSAVEETTESIAQIARGILGNVYKDKFKF